MIIFHEKTACVTGLQYKPFVSKVNGRATLLYVVTWHLQRDHNSTNVPNTK